MPMTPINHLAYPFGIADAEVLLGANRKHRLQYPGQRLCWTQLHSALRTRCPAQGGSKRAPACAKIANGVKQGERVVSVVLWALPPIGSLTPALSHPMGEGRGGA